MITFEHVTKCFGRSPVVADLTFTVAAQEAVALWGANGAGKTTILKCLLGLLDYRGQIRVDGVDVRKAGRVARRLLGYVPQELAFYDELSTLETVTFFARLKKVPPRQAAAALARVGLAGQEAKRVGALSGGMKQRLALGLALIGDPPVLVLDEPTSSLDTAARRQLLTLLGDLKAAGKTLLFTSHRVEEVETLADRVLVLEGGALQRQCPARELAERLGLRTQVKLRLPGNLLENAVQVLQADGFCVHRNGTGILVDVLPGEKAGPIHSLSRAAIQVTDFEIEGQPVTVPGAGARPSPR